jgi:membrane-bound lytic murein transglycosylase B
LLVLAAGILFSPSALNAENQPVYFKSLQDRLISDGFDEKGIRDLYARPEVRFESNGIAVYFVHRESKVNYDQYTEPPQIAKAKNYIVQHHEAFEEVEKAYGVDREVITAIILVETQLGTLLGSRSILNTLSTMSALSDSEVRDLLWEEVRNTPELTRSVFDQQSLRKSGWAYRELKAFLRHVQSEQYDPVAINGSFAGAMGISQFMPSNIDALARDGNNDGKINLFDDADAIASIAFYLKQHGWRPGIDRKKAAKVVYHYNHSDQYVDAILKIRDRLKG